MVSPSTTVSSVKTTSLVQDEPTEHHITLDQLQRCMPKTSKNLVNSTLVGEINDLLDSTPLRVNYRDNLLGYTDIMSQGKFRIRDYLKAIMYVSYKLMGESNIAAYTKTYPDRYQNFLNNGYNDRAIAAQVTGYHKSLLVTKLLEQTMVPSWVLNQDLYQKALNVQASLMLDAKSEKVRTDAANSILTHLKMPEAAKVKIDVEVKEDDSISELRKSTLELVKQQKQMLEAGVMNAREIAHSKIITDAEFVEVETDVS